MKPWCIQSIPFLGNVWSKIDHHITIICVRLLQWLVFSSFFSSDHRPHRVCTTFYRLHSRSHVLVSTRFTVNPAVTGSSPCTVDIFSALCDFFFEFFCHQRVAPSTFLIFWNRLDFQKVERVPL